MKISDAMRTGEVLLPRLAVLRWARREALFQERDAAGEEKERWRVVVSILDQTIRETERRITESLELLKFEVKGGVL